MMLKKHYLALILLQTLTVSQQILQSENGKDLPTNFNYDLLSRRRRPSSGAAGAGCNFNGIRGKPRTDATGRTFFDLQFINVDYHYNYDINCGGGGTNKPIAGDILHKPHHKPILGGLQQQGSNGEHQQGDFLNNRPLLSALLGNRPLQGIFSQSQSQTQTGVTGGALSGITSLLPRPQDVGQGLGEGISSFVSTLPQIGQSFQSLLPSFENFQFPALPFLPQGGQVGSPAPAPIAGGVPSASPDDTIYNDSVKPVHEDHDPVTDPFVTNKLPPGAYFNRNRVQVRYLQNKNYQNQGSSSYVNRNRYHYQRNGQPYGQNSEGYEGRSRNDDDDRDRSRTFRFPT